MSVYCSARRGGMVLGGLLIAVFVFSSLALAQDDQAPKYEIFAGYQWLHPGATVPGPSGTYMNPVGFKLPDMAAGAGGSFTYNFNKYTGAEADLGRNWTGSADETTLSVGPKIGVRYEEAKFFLHSLLSWNHLTTPGLGGRNGIGVIAGGGMGFVFNQHWGFRLFEVDYVWGHHNFSDAVSTEFGDLRRVNLNGVRLRTGLEYSWGYPETALPGASCSVQPSEVMVGEPVTATASASNFNPKHTLTYQWNSNGGKVMGKDNTASIDTNGMAGGSYTVTANITDPKMKKGGTVSCSANFTVKEPPKNPPTLSCSASPTSLQAGGSSTITCSCTSPDNVPVTVGDWSATGGNISGMGSTATLNTTGASAGPITVSATCTDSRGLKSPAASAQVTVENPPPPPVPQASKLSQCDFPNEKKPWRVDNTCKAILDDVAKNLQQNADNQLVIVGNADPAEKRKNLAAERAVDSKALSDGRRGQTGNRSQPHRNPHRQRRHQDSGILDCARWCDILGRRHARRG